MEIDITIIIILEVFILNETKTIRKRGQKNLEIIWSNRKCTYKIGFSNYETDTPGRKIYLSFY